MLYEKETYHFLVLHFPIALFITGYIFDIAGHLISNNSFSKFGFWNMGMGLFWGTISIITGFITDQDIGHMDNAFPIWTTHGTHMICGILFFLLIFILRILVLKERISISPIIIIVLHTVAIMFFMHGTHIGAKLAGIHI